MRPMVDAMEKMDQIQENLEGLQRSRREQEEIQEVLQWEGHYLTEEFLSQGAGDYAAINLQFQQYQNRLRDAKEKIQANTDAELKYSEALQKEEGIRRDTDLQQYQIDELVQKENDEKDRLISAMYAGRKQNLEWKLCDEILYKAEEKIQNYDSPSQGSEVQEAFYAEYGRFREKLRDESSVPEG